MRVAVERIGANSGARRVVGVAWSALPTGRTSVVCLASAGAITVPSVDCDAMAVAVQRMGASTRALWVIHKARGAGPTVSGRGIVGNTRSALWTGPLISTSAVALLHLVPCNRGGVVGAVGGNSAGWVAERIVAVLSVTSGASPTILGAHVPRSALVACRASPAVAAGAGTAG